MVGATERHGKLVTDLATQGFGLYELQMMGVTGRLPTDRAGPGDLADLQGGYQWLPWLYEVGWY